MEIILENQELKVKIDSFGAELTSLFDKRENKEYIWQKNPKFWAKSSPVLFPFVGAIKDKKYNYNGVEYEMLTNHGFARDNEFEIVSKSDNEALFLFKYSEETLKKYPFKFELYLKYCLKKTVLRLEYIVKNVDKDTMYYSIGGHPAFATPVGDGVDYQDYYIEFSKEESGEINILNGPLIDSQKKIKGFDGKKITLEKDRFINDAMIIENPKSDVVYLKNDKNGYNLKFAYDNFKYIAFWNKPGAEFVCIEPWNGISDYDDCNGKLIDKKGIEKLEKNSESRTKIEIEII